LGPEPAKRSPSIPGITLNEFISRLGSTDPVPGCGAAGAVALALGAACAAKALAISAAHTKDALQANAAERARKIASVALEGAQRDAADFQRWLKTHDPGAEAMLKADAHLLFALADELRQLIGAGRAHVIPSLIADLDAALDLASVCTAIEKRNLATP